MLITWLFSLINSDLDRNPPWSLFFSPPVSLAGLQFLVVDADSEAFGYRPSEGAPSAAEAAAYRYYVSLW